MKAIGLGVHMFKYVSVCTKRKISVVGLPFQTPMVDFSSNLLQLALTTTHCENTAVN